MMLYIFDMGGVVTTTAALDEKLSAVLGITAQEFQKFCAGNSVAGCAGNSVANCAGNSVADSAERNAEDRDLFKLCSDGIIGAKEFWSEFSRRSGIDVKTDWFHWLFHPERNEKTVALIKFLRSQGNRVVCGTNTIESHYLNHLERGDYAFFDQTYSSCLMGVSKPDTAFWSIILQAENTRAQDTVFIDDRPENCEAAASLGIRAIHFTTAENTAEALGIQAEDVF